MLGDAPPAFIYSKITSVFLGEERFAIVAHKFAHLMDRQRHSDVAGSIACNVIRVVEERDQRPFNVEVAHSRHLVDK